MLVAQLALVDLRNVYAAKDVSRHHFIIARNEGGSKEPLALRISCRANSRMRRDRSGQGRTRIRSRHPSMRHGVMDDLRARMQVQFLDAARLVGFH
jgi:hypothetical protein